MHVGKGTTLSSLNTMYEEALRVYSQNIRSIAKNFDKLKVGISGKHYDLICLQETWKIDSTYVMEDYYKHYFNARQNHRGGGVLIWLKTGLQHNIRSDISYFIEGVFESICVECHCRGRNVVVVNIYRPPRGDLRTFIDRLESQIAQIDDENKIPIIVGDINIDYSKLPTDLETILHTRSMTQLVMQHSRINSTSSTTLDHVYSKEDMKKHCRVKLIENHISDHKGVEISISKKAKIKRRKTDRIEQMLIKKSDVANLKIMLMRQNWENIFSGKTSTKMAELLQDKIDSYIKTNCLITLQKKKKENLWYTQDLRRMKRKLTTAYNKYITDKTNFVNKFKYKQAKVNYDRSIYEAKNNYYRRVLEKADPKLTWNVIKEVTRTKTAEESYQGLKESKYEINTNKPKKDAETFNNYFRKIARNMTNLIEPTDMDPHKYKPKQISGSFRFREVPLLGIKKCIKSLQPKTSYGTDTISNKLIKALGDELSEPLRLIVNKTLTTSEYPENWKTAKIKPLHKKGDKSEVNNYRPISLLPSLSKIIEKCMVHQITKYYDKHFLFPKHQYGYRHGKSTMDAINTLKERIMELNKKKKKYALIFLDFSKAFDTINHQILYKRLDNYGFCPEAITLIKSYLTNRKQKTQVLNHSSCEETLDEIGCPQGSCLGPVLYIMYTSDMANIKGAESSLFFADDTCLIIEHKQNRDNSLKTQIESALEEVQSWVSANKLCLNAKKTIVYIQNDETKNIVLGKDTIEVTPSNVSTKYLGVLVNPRLDWKEHINLVQNKMKRGLASIYRTKDTLDASCRKLLHYSMVESHLLYAYESWLTELNKKQYKPLYAIHKKSLRAVAKRHWVAHTASICKNLNMMKIEDRIELLTVKRLIQNLRDIDRGMAHTDERIHISQTRTRQAFTLTMATGSSKLKALYTNTFNKHKIQITENLTTLTKINKVKNTIVQKYTMPCTNVNCFSCSKSLDRRESI